MSESTTTSVLEAIVAENVAKKVTVAVSGGFDPIHVGHMRLVQEASKLGDELVVIVNNDNWLRTKKGFVFMPEEERVELLRSVKGVDRVVLTDHKPDDPDRSVCRALDTIKPTIFVNGGDRRNEDEIPESVVCRKHGTEMVFGIGFGGKVQSSSWLTNSMRQRVTESRPWGFFEVLKAEPHYWAKYIRVNAGQRLSLQKHSSRSETWLCVEGQVVAEVDGRTTILNYGDMIQFPAGAVHRLSSESGGSIIEVATGERVAEDDIERFQDDYGRA